MRGAGQASAPGGVRRGDRADGEEVRGGQELARALHGGAAALLPVRVRRVRPGAIGAAAVVRAVTHG